VYAIIEDSGQQFKVSQGDLLRVDLRELDEKAQTLEFGRVLLVGDGEKVTVGTPLVEGAKVVGQILKALVAGPKLITYKYKRRKGSRRKRGHRQKFVEVRITSISL
jgi:large subunit ribosomal protein L21